MKVIYTVEFAIEVEATNKTMAVHEAGEQWPELRDQALGVASGVAIKRIRVEGAKGPDDGG